MSKFEYKELENLEYSHSEEMFLQNYQKIEEDNCGILLWLFNSYESRVYFKLPFDIRTVLLEFVIPCETYTIKRILWKY